MREEIRLGGGSLSSPPGARVPVRATKCGRHRRLARMMSFMSSRSGLEVNVPVYRYSSTALMQLLLV